MKSKGFTLIELLIVIAIIGLLSTFLLANLIGAKARARDAQRKSDLRQIQSALELYRSDQDTYPASLPGCNNALKDPSGANTYIKQTPCDPSTSSAYTYASIGGGTGYTIIACLENTNDSQKDAANKAPCTGGTTNWSFTVTNP